MSNSSPGWANLDKREGWQQEFGQQYNCVDERNAMHDPPRHFMARYFNIPEASFNPTLAAGGAPKHRQPP